MANRATDLVGLTLSVLLAGAGLAIPAERAAARTPTIQHPVASEARVGGDDRHTRFVLDLTQKIELRAFTLADPYRVVIDLPQVTFNLAPRTGEAGRGLIKAFRYGLVMQGGSRIVFDLAKPVRIEKAFVLDPVNGQPARLVLDLAATDRESFLRAIAQENRPIRTTSTGALDRDPPKAGDQRPLIVIDPGHGGVDFGAVASSGVTEKTIVLEFANVLRDRIEGTGKFRVAMTRTDDSFVPLSDRIRMARIRQAALFISIHADALRRGEGAAQGATVYTLSETASDAEAARLAENENRADVIAGIDLSREPDDVADILIDLAQRETKGFSIHFAKFLVGELRKVARLHKQPLKSAGFKVLKAPDVPSVLIELGYVSSKDDLKLLTSDAWRAKTAGSMAQAIDAFFSTRVAGAPGARR
ncbi:MAG: AMIN domain-containing protein [Alphaproteobacteria bacterium]|nr:AMIN domain-containing protein [Alphaproteobacteria bacterium]